MSAAPDTVVPALAAHPGTAAVPAETGAAADGRPDDGGSAEAARRLRLAVARLGRRMAHAHPDAGVTPTRLVALGVLELTGPVRIGALAERLRISAPTTSRLVECLHELGLVARTPDPDDHRATRVGLTPAGAGCLHEHRTRATDDLTARIHDLSTDRRALLSGALSVLEELAWPDTRPT